MRKGMCVIVSVAPLIWPRCCCRLPPQGTLQKNGYCNPANPKDCQTFPVVAGEIGTNFQSPVDTQYYNDMATFFNKQPPADAYTSAAFNNWFWW